MSYVPGGPSAAGRRDPITDTPLAWRPGTGDELVGRYRISGLIARGGMADVYRGHDARLDRAVAIKVFRAGAADPARFHNEVALLARLQHPHLVQVLDAAEHAGLPFVVLELCGEPVSQRLAGGALPSDVVAEIGRGVASALAYIHRAGVLHRDVKPSNILLGQDGRALLADFGVARLIDSSRLTATAMAVGTPAYLAPEQLTDGEVDPPADIYSLGLVLLEALTGKPAFAGTQQELLAARVARLPDIPSALPAPWRPLLTAMTARDRHRRPNGAAVSSALEPARLTDRDVTVVLPSADHTAVMPTPINPLPTASPRRRHRMAAWTGAIALGATVVVALVLLASGTHRSDPGQPPVTSATTTPPTTASVASTAPAAAPPSDEPQAACLEIERQKQALEDQKQQLEEQYRDDKDTREQLKEGLEDEKRSIEEQKQQLGC